jgi:sugar O-acyltransferase (sialic acid O-acetyltransferase NeuD family)
MKHLIIIGAGGMGRTMYDMARESIGYSIEYDIRGFIDDNTSALDNFDNYPPLLAPIHSYQPKEDEVFVCSIGGAARQQCMEAILNKGGQFLTMIHATARIGTNVQIGEGTIIGAYTTIGADAKIGQYNLIQSYTVIGHDSVIGNWNRIDTHVTLVGGTIVQDGADIHTSAMISHNVTIESHSRVAACSFVIRRVKEGTTVLGNPAKKLL